MGESLVEAVLRQQNLKRELKLRSASGAEVPARPPRPRPSTVVETARLAGRNPFECVCGCGRPVDPRNELGLSRTCVVGKLQAMWRRAPPELRAILLDLLR